jgi:prevent-host-death family protein
VPSRPRPPSDTWTLQDAKSRLSEVLRRARTDGPQRLTVHGRESAVVLSVEEFRRLKGEGPTGQMLVDALRAAPYPEIELDVPREPSPMRDVAL